MQVSMNSVRFGLFSAQNRDALLTPQARPTTGSIQQEIDLLQQTVPHLQDDRSKVGFLVQVAETAEKNRQTSELGVFTSIPGTNNSPQEQNQSRLRKMFNDVLGPITQLGSVRMLVENLSRLPFVIDNTMETLTADHQQNLIQKG